MSMFYRTLAYTVVAIVIIATALVSRPCPVAASTVVPMNLETLADHAGQVIVGHVADVRSYWADPGGPERRIESEVTFHQVEYLKGALRNSTSVFTLTIPGGTVGDVRMQVCCAPSFAAGDKWILFLLPAYRTFPVVGLYQGAFLVRPDDEGIERVYRARHDALQPITGIDADDFVRLAAGTRNTVQEHLVAANRIRFNPEAVSAEPAAAMPYEDFVAQIRPLVDNSRSYALVRPSGHRILVDYNPASLKRSPLE